MSHFIDGRWIPGEGRPLVSSNPATGESCWVGRAATRGEVDRAIDTALCAAEQWSITPLDERLSCLRAFAGLVERRKAEVAEAISIETGKPRWEALAEAASMVAKVPASADAIGERRAPASVELEGMRGVTRYRSHGVLLVFGPFNFPGHISHGHIVPALLAGNAVVFKPSEQTPGVAALSVELWREAGLPPGVLNLVQGARETGEALVEHPGHDGVLFTGSFATGAAIQKALADQPHKLLALEMGGNNPLVVHRPSDPLAAAYLALQSAYLTAGQRCTCARRLIVTDSPEGDRFLDALTGMIGRIRIGPYTMAPEPFMGPLIGPHAADSIVHEQDSLIERGGVPLVELRRIEAGPAFVSPGLVDVTNVTDREDREVFGPLLQLIRAADFDEAVREANDTSYGLVAGLVCDDEKLYERFVGRVRAGVINWNRQTTGASGRLPFGGVGRSGNHRPAGYFAIDACNYPVASLESPTLAMPDKITPGIDLQ